MIRFFIKPNSNSQYKNPFLRTKTMVTNSIFYCKKYTGEQQHYGIEYLFNMSTKGYVDKRMFFKMNSLYLS